MPDRLTLERHQVWIYLAAIGLGLVTGRAAPAVGPLFDGLLWPALMLLLYATFIQTPLLHLRDAWRDRRFTLTMLVGNFIILPFLVWLLTLWLPPDPAVRLGVLLVLLAPCTDWFVTFSHLGGGDTPRAIAVTPLNLLVQLLLLPIYLWIMVGADVAPGPSEVWPALLVVFTPLVLAAGIGRWIEARPERAVWRERTAWTIVPLLSIVVFLIAGAQVSAVYEAVHILPWVIPVYVLFLALAAPVAWVLTRLAALPPRQGRTLAFSFGTRNSFVMLPFALSLPPGWETAAVVIVVQSLVELLGMGIYLWWAPRVLFR